MVKGFICVGKPWKAPTVAGKSHGFHSRCSTSRWALWPVTVASFWDTHDDIRVVFFFFFPGGRGWNPELWHVVSVLWSLPHFATLQYSVLLYYMIRCIFYNFFLIIYSPHVYISRFDGFIRGIPLYVGQTVYLQRWIHNADEWSPIREVNDDYLFRWSLRLLWMDRAIHSKVATRNDVLTKHAHLPIWLRYRIV